MDDLRLASLLCSRLCHDLVGPVGAIGNGCELLEDPNSAQIHKEAISLVADSARSARHRLQFFRVAFGLPGGGSIQIGLDRTRALADDFLADGKVALAWPAAALQGAPSLFADEQRLLLNLILLGAETLPRGGTVTVQFREGALQLAMTVTASGEPVRLAEPTRLALRQEIPIEELEARTAPALFAALLAQRINAELRIDAAVPGNLSLVALLHR